MKASWLVLVMVALLLFALVGPTAAAVSVTCNGTQCGGTGIRDFQYNVTVAGGGTFTDFAVGAQLPHPLSSDWPGADWLVPAGWSHEVVSGTAYKHSWSLTPHGEISPGGDNWWPHYIRWSGPAVSSGSFGYNFRPLGGFKTYDSGWSVGTACENWLAPVGMGTGPLHAPLYPEPSGLLALAGGLGGLGGVFFRRRRR